MPSLGAPGYPGAPSTSARRLVTMTAASASSAQTSAALGALLVRSRDLILANQAPSGAFPAAPTYPVYRYCWLRDGSFIAEGLSAVGERLAAQDFYRWCARTIEARSSLIEDVAIAATAGER